MRFTALEIRGHEFKKSFRGYESEEVDIFLDALASDLESLLKEREGLVSRMAALEQKLSEFKELEHNLRDTLLMAKKIASEAEDSGQRRADALICQARMQSDDIVKEAEARGRTIIAESEERRRATQLEVDEIESRKLYALSRLRSLFDDQKAVLDAHSEREAEDEPAPPRVISIPAPRRGAAKTGD